MLVRKSHKPACCAADDELFREPHHRHNDTFWCAYTHVCFARVGPLWRLRVLAAGTTCSTPLARRRLRPTGQRLPRTCSEPPHPSTCCRPPNATSLTACNRWRGGRVRDHPGGKDRWTQGLGTHCERGNSVLVTCRVLAVVLMVARPASEVATRGASNFNVRSAGMHAPGQPQQRLPSRRSSYIACSLHSWLGIFVYRSQHSRSCAWYSLPLASAPLAGRTLLPHACAVRCSCTGIWSQNSGLSCKLGGATLFINLFIKCSAVRRLSCRSMR